MVAHPCLCLVSGSPFRRQSEMCQGPVSCSRCSLQSFFVACFGLCVSGCFHPLQMFQKARSFVAVCRIPVRCTSKSPVSRRGTRSISLWAQHSCCQHFSRFQIKPLQRDFRHRVFHNSNGVFRDRFLPRCLSGRRSRTICMSLNLSCTSLLRQTPSRSVRSVCIRPKTDIHRSCNSLSTRLPSMFPTF